MKNHYLNKNSGGSGQGCFDSSKNTQPQFVFRGDFGPAGGFQHKPDFRPTRINSKTTQKKAATTTTTITRTKPSHLIKEAQDQDHEEPIPQQRFGEPKPVMF